MLYSGKHDNSVMGVNSGDYDAAPVASDVFKRMAERGQVKEADFRVIWKSQTFPTSSFAYAHDLEPKLRDTMLKCFYDYRFPAEMQKAFGGADRFSDYILRTGDRAQCRGRHGENSPGRIRCMRKETEAGQKAPNSDAANIAVIH